MMLLIESCLGAYSHSHMIAKPFDIMSVPVQLRHTSSIYQTPKRFSHVGVEQQSLNFPHNHYQPKLDRLVRTSRYLLMMS